jgi:hypothetical protein
MTPARDRHWPNIVSYVFHPLFVPTYAVASYFSLRIDFFTLPQKYLILVQVSLMTVILPLLFFLLLRSMGRVASVMIPDPSQRRWPLIFQITLLFLLITRSLTADISPVLFNFFLGGIISSAIAFGLLFLRMKISLHALSMAAWLGLMLSLAWHFALAIDVTLAILMLLTGAVLSARLFLKAHTVTELAIGFVSGLIPQLVLSAFWL